MNQLLDGIHEDLNLVKKKPYIEIPDSNGRPDSEVAAEQWAIHEARNRSIVQSVFGGQYKSAVKCFECRKVSLTFDPFSQVTLPLQSSQQRRLNLFIMPNEAFDKIDYFSPSVPTEITISLKPSATFGDVCTQLSEYLGVSINSLILANVDEGLVRRMYASSDSIAAVSDDDIIVVYKQADIPIARTTGRGEDSIVNLFVINRHIQPNGTAEPLAIPFLVSIPATPTVKCLHARQRIWRHVKSYGAFPASWDDNKGPQKLHLTISNYDILSDYGTHPITEEPVFPAGGSDTLLGAFQDIDPYTTDSGFSYHFLSLHWNHQDVRTIANNSDTSLLQTEAFAVNIHPSVNEVVPPVDDHLTLESCIEAFSNPEIMDEDNQYYCSHCKQRVNATKTIQLYKLPPVLIFQLNRFRNTGTGHRHKVDSFVDFPISNLDMSKYSIVNTGDNACRDCTYDLFAVSNHYGSIGFGHYTAMARSWSRDGKSSLDESWFEFDDSTIRPVGDERKICTSAAYLLFYRRRGLKEDILPTPASEGSEGERLPTKKGKRKKKASKEKQSQ